MISADAFEPVFVYVFVCAFVFVGVCFFDYIFVCVFVGVCVCFFVCVFVCVFVSIYLLILCVCCLVQATGVRLGMMFQSLASIGTGIVIGFVYCWQLALFIIGFMPFILIAGMLQMKVAKGFSGKNNAALEEAGKVLKYLVVLFLRYLLGCF